MSRRDRHRSRSPWGRLVMGLLIVTFGVIFLLDQWGVAEAEALMDWWPVAFLAFGLASLLSGSFFAALLWFAVGAVLLLPRFGIETFGIWKLVDLWPLFISTAGVILIWQALRPAPKDVFGERASVFRAGAFMSGNTHSIGSTDFLGGEAVACMGGCDIDLRRAELRGDEAVIDVLAFWGGIGIKIPPSWTVENRVAGILGSLEDRTSGGDGKKRLILRGSAIMGGVEVTNG